MQNFWDPQVYYAVSQETREYVPMVLAAAWLFMHPERYNLEFPKVSGPARQHHAGAPGIDRRAHDLPRPGRQRGSRLVPHLAQSESAVDPQEAAAGRHANSSVPAQLEAVYARDCAQGQWPTLAAELHSAIVPTPPPASLVRTQQIKPRGYVVRKGDTLSSIARKLGCSGVREIAAANGLRGPHYPIHPGKTLRIPELRRRT